MSISPGTDDKLCAVSVNVTTNLCQIVHYVILCYDEREIVFKAFTFINQGVVETDRVAPGPSIF